MGVRLRGDARLRSIPGVIWINARKFREMRIFEGLASLSKPRELAIDRLAEHDFGSRLNSRTGSARRDAAARRAVLDFNRLPKRSFHQALDRALRPGLAGTVPVSRSTHSETGTELSHSDHLNMQEALEKAGLVTGLSFKAADLEAVVRAYGLYFGASPKASLIGLYQSALECIGDDVTGYPVIVPGRNSGATGERELIESYVENHNSSFCPVL